jgi:hypothetical protein
MPIPMMPGPRDPEGMKRASLVIVVLVGAAAGPGCGSELASDSPTEAPPAPTPAVDAAPPAGAGFPCDVHAVLQTSCASCHAGRLYYGPNFDSRDDLLRPAAELFLVASHPVAPGTFGEHVATALREGTMPPYGAPASPSAAERERVIGWIAAGMPTGDCGGLSSAP